MTVEIRRARPDDVEALVNLDFRNFGGVVGDGDVEAAATEIDTDRFLMAWDGDRPVAAAGSFELGLTVPGGATLPMSGVAWVSVAATHRRRGLARRLMTGLDELSAGFGEPILGLFATEGGIYERFGYGPATRIRLVEIDRTRAVLDPRRRPDPVELIEAQDHVDALIERWDRFRMAQVGEVSRPEGLFRSLLIDRSGPTWAALHPDGYAVYSIEPHWNDGHPAHRLTVIEIVAITPEAHLALWHLLLSVDLVGPIRCLRGLALDDPLPWLLTDPRQVRTAALNDGLWLKVTDPVRCFDARSYRVDDRLVVGVVDTVDDLDEAPGRSIEVGPDGCGETDEAPELVAARPALGPLLLGASATELAAGGRLRADAGILDRADALFGTGRHAHCRTSF